MKTLGSVVALVGAMMVSGAATAATYTFDATDVGAFGAGPYGTVTTTQNGSNVDFSVVLRSDLNFVNTGGPHSVFSFNANGVSASDIINVLFNGLGSSKYTVVSPGGNSPFGASFSLAIDCTATGPTGCKNGAPGQISDPLTFSVLNASESDFGFLAAGTTAFFASDVICVTGSCNGATGAVGVTRTPEVPVPGTLGLLGLGLAGLGLVRRKQ